MKTINENFRYLLSLVLLATFFSAGIAQSKEYISDKYTTGQYKYLRGNDQYYLYELADLNSYSPQSQLPHKEKTDTEAGSNSYANESNEVSTPLFLSKSPAANQYTFQVEDTNRTLVKSPGQKYNRDKSYLSKP